MDVQSQKASFPREFQIRQRSSRRLLYEPMQEHEFVTNDGEKSARCPLEAERKLRKQFLLESIP